MFDEMLEEEYVEVPEPEHVSTVMEGLIDTVTGNEGFTYAQHYLHSCVQSSGGISSRTGTEGFFGSIGNGLKAAWDYIMKMFKSIWNFFFGGDEAAEKEAKKLGDKIEAVEQKVKDEVAGPKTQEEAKEKIHEVKAKVKRAAASSKKPAEVKAAHDLIEKLDRVLTANLSDQKTALKSVGQFMAAQDEIQGEVMGIGLAAKSQIDRERKSGFKLEKFKDSDNHIVKDFKSFAVDIMGFVQGVEKQIDVLDKQKFDPSHIPGLVVMVKGLKKDVMDHITRIHGRKSNTEKMIKDLETKIKGNKEDKSLKEDLEVANAVLHDLAKVVKIINIVVTAGGKLMGVVDRILV